jgi:hypothetical protein
VSYSTEVLADSPLVYLRLGDASGTTATDSSGNSMDGTYVGSPTLGVAGALAGDSDTAVTFNGSTQAATVPSTGLPTTDVDQTIECWVKFTTTSDTLAIVTRDTDSTHRGLGIYTSTGGKLKAGNSGAGYAISPSAYNDGNWHHVVGIRHQTAGTFELYVDKTSVATATFTNPSATSILAIAERGNGTLRFPGTIDEVAYYTTALSSTRITAHYNAGASTTKHGSVSGTFSFAGVATGHKTTHGTVSGTVAWAGSATGHEAPHGTSAGTFSFAGSTTGHMDPAGTVAGGFAFAGAASGSAPVIGNHGAAAGTVTFTGSGAGSITTTGTTSGSFAWAGAAAGHTDYSGSAAGGFTFTGIARGPVTTPTARSYTVPAYNRSYLVPAYDRTYLVPARP